MKQYIRRGLIQIERQFSRCFPNELNPFYNLGALSFLFFWIITFTGVYLFIFFETSVRGAHASIAKITEEHFIVGSLMRSFHRYASGAMAVTVTLHLVREYVMDRYKGVRWFSWVSGVPLLWLLFASAIGGYWLVWDIQGQYIALAVARWFDWLPFMVDPMAANFLNQDTLSDRFFSLLVFLHIGIPLALLLGMFIHIKRISYAKTMPPRALTGGVVAGLLAVSLLFPAHSQAPANLDKILLSVNLDWIYLNVFPLIELWGPGEIWFLLVGLSGTLSVLPWLPWRAHVSRPPIAVVDPDNCNGCGWCQADCPYEAVQMIPHAFKTGHRQSLVDPDLCISCGICAGACPSSSPFRHVDELITGISIPGFHIKELLSLTEKKLSQLYGKSRVMVYGCDHGSSLDNIETTSIAAISMPCTALLPPAFIDYVLRRGGASGVLVTGCCAGDCHFRLGDKWMMQRFYGDRNPILRTRVPRERVRVIWPGAMGEQNLEAELSKFHRDLASVDAIVRD